MASIVHVVSIKGIEGEMESVAVFSSYSKARRFVRKYEISTWSIECLEVDVDPNDSDDGEVK